MTAGPVAQAQLDALAAEFGVSLWLDYNSEADAVAVWCGDPAIAAWCDHDAEIIATGPTDESAIAQARAHLGAP